MKVLMLNSQDYGQSDRVLGVFDDYDFIYAYVYNHFDEIFGEGELENYLEDCEIETPIEVYEYLTQDDIIRVDTFPTNPV